MKLSAIAFLLFPFLLTGQTTPEPRYQDGLFAAGAVDDAASIDVQEKLRIHALRIVSPRVIVGTLLTAGVRQWENSPGKWGRGWDGYGKRYGTDYARIAIRESLAFGIDSAAHLDPRFFRAPESSSTSTRLKHALTQVVIAHTDSGGRNFAYGQVLSAFAAGEAGSLWQPRRSDGRFGDGLVYAGILLAGDAGRNVFREFWPDIHRKLRRKP